ncbi:hypothetical protein DFH27DRAFT_604859 [Peziza echinospora]|nr:hypothetical protein DFH27DRAFT_604859 [Peziza echinospora]
MKFILYILPSLLLYGVNGSPIELTTELQINDVRFRVNTITAAPVEPTLTTIALSPNTTSSSPTLATPTPTCLPGTPGGIPLWSHMVLSMHADHSYTITFGPDKRTQSGERLDEQEAERGQACREGLRVHPHVRTSRCGF